MSHHQLARDYIEKSIENSGMAAGICHGLAGIAFALLFVKNGYDSNKVLALKMADRTIEYRGSAPGLCYGLVAIIHAILS